MFNNQPKYSYKVCHLKKQVIIFLKIFKKFLIKNKIDKKFARIAFILNPLENKEIDKKIDVRVYSSFINYDHSYIENII